jgi:hypothetical protein
VLRRTDDLALLMGRVFVAALFLPHGLHKLMNFWSFAASLGANGVPYSNAIAVLAVVAEILGPLTLIIGLWPRWTVGIGRAHPPQNCDNLSLRTVGSGISAAAERGTVPQPRNSGRAAVLFRERSWSLELGKRNE